MSVNIFRPEKFAGTNFRSFEQNKKHPQALFYDLFYCKISQ